MPHVQSASETSMSEVYMDFAFLEREDDPQRTVPVLVAKERTSNMFSATVPRKTAGTCVVNRVVEILREVGCLHGDMVVKSDQEPALRSIVEDVARLKVAHGSGRHVVE